MSEMYDTFDANVTFVEILTQNFGVNFSLRNDHIHNGHVKMKQYGDTLFAKSKLHCFISKLIKIDQNCNNQQRFFRIKIFWDILMFELAQQ